jgi:hypothetical protein
MEDSMRNKRRWAFLISGAMVVALAVSLFVARRAEAVQADCIIDLVGKNNDEVSILCAAVVGGEARGRADCAFAPDVYTSWVRSWQADVSGPCLFSARKAILEVR